MSVWLAAAIALCCGFVPLTVVCARADSLSALASLNLAGVLTLLTLLTLTVAFSRQAFVDLAVVLATLSPVGLLAFVRFLERRQ